MSDTLTQREAVYRAVMSCRDENGHYDRKEVIETMFTMYQAGEWSIKTSSQKESDDAKRAYIGSLITNWTKKDPRLSGSPVHTPERKKRKPADDEMKRLMLAKIVLLNESQSTEEIDALIQQRQDEISAAKNKRAAATTQLLENC